MNVPRPIAGLLVLGLAVPALAAAPRDHVPPAVQTASPPPRMGTRVFARADGSTVAQASSPAPSPSPSPATSTPPVAASASPETAAKAKTEFLAWQGGAIDLNRYIPEARAQFTPQFVAELSAKYLKPLGAVQTFTQVQKTTMQGAEVFVFRAHCDKGDENMAVSWNDAGLVQFIRFAPASS